MAVASGSIPTPARPLLSLPFEGGAVVALASATGVSRGSRPLERHPQTAVEIRREIERQEVSAASGGNSALPRSGDLTVDPLLPAAAPLPSLRMALSRRAALFGAVAATGFLGAAAVESLPTLAGVLKSEETPERMVGLYHASLPLLAYANDPDLSEEVSDAAYDRRSELQREAYDLRITTLPGALASLEWARQEFASCYIDKASDPDWLDHFTLVMIDNALGVLRQAVAA